MARSPFERLRSGVSRIGKALWGTIWLQLIVLAGLAVAIHWALFTGGSGCVSWGNYSLPCTPDQYRLYSPLLSAWDPYHFMGGPITVPFESVLAQIAILNTVWALADVAGTQGAATAYAILTTVWVGFTFSLFSRAFVRSYWGQFAGAILAAAGPFQLQVIGQGDYGQFVSEGLVLLSIYFLWRALEVPDRRWIFYPASLAALLLSFELVQIFLVGLVLYVASFLAFTLIFPPDPFRARLVNAGRLAVRFLALPLLLAPVILPALLSPSVSLAPSSPYATPLSTFTSFSASPWAMFFGLGYVSGSSTQLTNFQGWGYVASATNATVADLWLALILIGVTLVWALALLFRDRRAYALFAVAVVGSLLGSGTTGPLGGFNTYLYTHLIGYQELNASYFWDWILVVPAFLLALGVLVERLEARYRSHESGDPSPREPTGSRPPWGRGAWAVRRLVPHRSGTRAILVGLAVLFAVLLVLPYSVSAQNGPIQGAPVGIQVFHYPRDYGQIPAQLSQLTGSTYAGVAVFNPASTWKWQTTGSLVPSYFYYFPAARTSTPPGYAQPPYASSFYSYWVYQEFYTNATKYIGPLFASVGVGYLLVFYNTEPSLAYQFPFVQGQNASELMRYQVGIVPLIETSDYAIYRDTYFGGSSAALAHLSIVAGGYSELNAMAYAGVNLTAQAEVFPSDIPSGQCSRYLDLTSRIYTESTNALIGLALACTAYRSTDPVTALAAGGSVYDGWSSSYSVLNGALGRSVVSDWPVPLAVTQGGPHTLSIPVDARSCAACRLWLPVRFASDGGSLTFDWSGSTFTLLTNRSYDQLYNAMVWTELPFDVGSRIGTLAITSGPGWNAIGSVYTASPASLDAWQASLATSQSIVLAQPGETLTVPTPTVGSRSASSYCSFSTSNALDARALCESASSTSNLTLNISLPGNSAGGSISLLVRANGSLNAEVGPANGPQFGFADPAPTPSNDSWGWIRIPFASALAPANSVLSLRVTGGNLTLSEVVVAPSGLYAPSTAAVPAPVLSVATTVLDPAVTSFRLNLSQLAPGDQELNGTIGYGPVVSGAVLATVTLDRTPPGVSDLGLRYNVSNGLRLELDGIIVGGASISGNSLFSRALLSQDHPGLPTTSILEVIAAGTGSSPGTAFSLEVEPISMAVSSTVTDLAPGPSWSVSEQSTGYQLTGPAADLLLVRVPFYPNLLLSGGAGNLAPAEGSVDSLILAPDNSTSFHVEPAAVGDLDLGYAISGGTLLAWVAVELTVRRWRKSSLTPKPRADAAVE